MSYQELIQLIAQEYNLELDNDQEQEDVLPTQSDIETLPDYYGPQAI